ncbi:MAG: hypothetical protein Fur0037_24890 [Planctomycetota bacterium]
MTGRLAAAILLTRDGRNGKEVFLVERAPELRFFGGYAALPGGTLSDADGPARGGEESKAFARCALRELFEETGLVVHDLPPERRTPEALQEARSALLASERPADDGDAPESPWPALTAGCPEVLPRELCRIVTPPFVPRRYDTRFFHVDISDCRASTTGVIEPEIVRGELVGGRFVDPREALDSWKRGEIRIVPPVLILLEHLAEANTFEEFASSIARTAGSYAAGSLHEVRFVPGAVLAPLLSPTLPPATTTNCYVIGNEDLYVLDPASPHEGEQRRLLALLGELCAKRRARVRGILASHHHPDHVGGIEALSRALELPVRGHPETLPRLPGRFRTGEPLLDGDQIDLGEAPDGTRPWTLLAVHTPGHDRGHLCFADSRYGALFAGDMLSTISTIIVDPPEGHLSTYLRSLERLEAIPFSMLLPAHGPPTVDGKGLIRKYLRHRRQREASLMEALRAGASTLEELLPKVYWDADRSLYRFAERSLLAGLEKLVEDGLAVRHGGGWRPA